MPSVLLHNGFDDARAATLWNTGLFTREGNEIDVLLQLLVSPLFVYVVVIIEALVVHVIILSLVRPSLARVSSWPLRTRMRLNEIRRCFTVICTRVRRQCHSHCLHFIGLIDRATVP